MERATVPTGERVYAIGDIHGCLELLHELRQKIVADAASRPIQHNTVVYLGDYIDRGRNSKGVLDLLIREPLEGFESVHLMGNHEAFMRNFLRDGGYPMNWLWNGGDATLDSYGTGHENAEDLRQWLIDHLPVEHKIFLGDLKLKHTIGCYLFVHAGIQPGVGLEEQDENDLLWIRDPFLDSIDDHGKVVVHGHTISDEPVVRPNRIGIDTGAYRNGKLTALVLEGDFHRFLQVGF